MSKFRYLTSCVGLGTRDVSALDEMTDNAREVTLKTFRSHCDTAEWERSLGYERGPGKRRQGYLTLSNDWHVAYFKSRFKGQPCYYAVHSAIEHIFVREGP